MIYKLAFTKFRKIQKDLKRFEKRNKFNFRK